MSEDRLKRGLKPSHPGEILREVVVPGLAEQGVNVLRFAEDLGVTRRMLYKILDGDSAVTPAMALRLSKYLGTSAELWLNLQAAYDLHQLRQQMADELAGIPTVKTPPALPPEA